MDDTLKKYRENDLAVDLMALEIELINFKKGKQTIDSCTNEKQLENAEEFIRLIGHQHPGASSALKYFWLLKYREIEKS